LNQGLFNMIFMLFASCKKNLIIIGLVALKSGGFLLN